MNLHLIRTLALCLVQPPAAASAAPGDLDVTFGTGGKVVTSIDYGNDYGYALAVQSDGKIVVAGCFDNGNLDLVLLRYQTNGALDVSFGNQGEAVTLIAALDDYGRAVVVQGDGKIVTAGHSDLGGNTDFVLTRHHSNGTLDTLKIPI